MDVLAIPCPKCEAGNKPLARFCRRCGVPLGEAGAEFPAGRQWKLRWRAAGQTGRRIQAMFGLPGAVALLDPTGAVQLLTPAGKVWCPWQEAGPEPLWSAPGLARGLLLLPKAKGLEVVDLLDRSGVSPPPHPRARFLSLPGPPLSHLSCRGDYFAVVCRQPDQISLWLGRVAAEGAEWLWSRTLPGEAGADPWGCACDEAGGVWVSTPEGTVRHFGGAARESSCTELGRPVLAASLQARGDWVSVAAEREELFCWRAGESVWRSAWLGSGGHSVSLKLGEGWALWLGTREHAWVDLESGTSRSFSLPQRVVAPPCLSQEGALLISYPGTLYQMSFSERTPRLVGQSPGPSGVGGCTLEPVCVGDVAVVAGAHGELAGFTVETAEEVEDA